MSSKMYVDFEALPITSHSLVRTMGVSATCSKSNTGSFRMIKSSLKASVLCWWALNVCSDVENEASNAWVRDMVSNTSSLASWVWGASRQLKALARSSNRKL